MNNQRLTQLIRTRTRRSGRVTFRDNAIVTSMQIKDPHQKLEQRYLCQMRDYQRIKASGFLRRTGDIHPEGVEESDRCSYIGDGLS